MKTNFAVVFWSTKTEHLSYAAQTYELIGCNLISRPTYTYNQPFWWAIRAASILLFACSLLIASAAANAKR